MNFSLQQLRSFSVLADSLNFTAAAQRLHVTQPTLSATIRNLEDTLGARLFDRDTRKVRLTSFGAESLKLFAQVLSEAERAENELREIVKGQRGTVRIAALPQVFKEFLRPVLGEFHQLHPHIRLEARDIESEDALAQLRRGSVDMALALMITDESDLAHAVIGEQVMVAVLPRAHPLAAESTVCWRQLEKEPLVLVQSAGSTGGYVNRRLAKAGIAVHWTHRVQQLLTAASLIDAGFGVGLMSNHSAAHLVDEGLVIREITQPRIARPLCLMTRKEHDLSPSARALHAKILEHFPPLPPLQG